MKNTTLTFNYVKDPQDADPGLVPKFKEDPVIIKFKFITNTYRPNYDSEEYNLGLYAWPTANWMKINAKNFLDTDVRPMGYFSNYGIIHVYRVLREREINSLKYPIWMDASLKRLNTVFITKITLQELEGV